MSLRLKLLLAASVLLAVPFAGYRFVLAMEAFLRANQVEAAADAAGTLARALQGHPGLSAPARAAAEPGIIELHAPPLAAAPDVDGYDGDWSELATDAARREPQARAGTHGPSLFLLLRVPRTDTGARRLVRLVLQDAPGFRRAWLLDLSTPGPLAVSEVPPAPGSLAPTHLDSRISAAASRDAQSTVIELRLPLALAAPHVTFELLGRSPSGAVTLPPGGLFRLQLPPPGLQQALARLGTGPGRRLRVIDGSARMLAQVGSLERDLDRSRFGTLLEGLLDADEDSLLSLAPGTLRLAGPEIDGALAGTPMARLRQDPVSQSNVVSAAAPLRRGDAVVGALVLEESTSAIQALARRALLELVAAAALAFIAGTAALLLVAGRTAARLSELRDQARRSVDADGRVRSAFKASPASDEIGDLGRSFEAAASRLQGYQDYLEQLARRLSHELRTPIAMVRSSLDNLALAGPVDEDAQPSLARARQGVERLDALIRRMSEATRLEQAMSDTELLRIDLAALARSAVDAQPADARGLSVTLAAGPGEYPLDGSPDLLLQALDKLLANARDFAAAATTLTVQVARSEQWLELAVENVGEALPAGPPQRLFDSMVSERRAGDEGEPHLGLGLYVVRLVARFHGGSEFAENAGTGPDGTTRVRVGMRLPASQRGGAPGSTGIRAARPQI